MVRYVRQRIAGALLALAAVCAALPAGAQQSDTDAMLKRYRELYAAGDYGAALAQAQKLEAAVRARSGTNNRNYVAAILVVAQAQRSRGQNAEAEAIYKRALTILQKAPGTSEIEFAFTRQYLAETYADLGRDKEAEALFDRVLPVLEQHLGGDHPRVADLVANIATLQRHQSRYDQAERLYKRALSIREKASDAVGAAAALNGLGVLYSNLSRYAEAEQALKRALSLREKALDPTHPLVAEGLSSIATLYARQGRYGDAEAAFKRAIAISEKALGREHATVAQDLGSLATVLSEQARYAEAEQMYQRSLSIEEKALGSTHPQLAATLNNLAALYGKLERHDDAEALMKRALSIYEQRLSPDHADVAFTLNNLGFVYREQGRHGEAEALHRRALAIREKALGPDHPLVAASLNNLVSALRALGRKQELEALLKRALAIAEKAQGPNHPDVALRLGNLAVLQFDEQARHDEAERLLKRALSIVQTALGANHPDVVATLYTLARNEARRGNHIAALDYARQASRAALAHAAAGSGRGEREGEQARGVESNATYFLEHVAQLAAVARQQPPRGQSLGQEAFEIAQWASQTAASAAIQQMAARFASGGGELGAIVRERQDLASLWREKEKALLAAIAKGESEKNKTDLLRQEIVDVARRFGAVSDRLRREFPDFAALATPRPLTVDEVQKLLAADEALAFWLVDDRETHVFAVSRDSFDWATIETGGTAMVEKIAAFRRGLDVDQLTQSIDRNDKPVLFDLGLAHELYTALLKPVDRVLTGKRHLLVVPTGPLTAVPFHLLLTEAPALARPELKDLQVYREAAWLLKRHATSVLPSVGSLQALRVFARKGQATKPLVGFGDPVFGQDRPDGAQGGRKIAARTRAFADYWKGAGVDRARLAAALPRLADTADELKAVARRLGAPASDIHLRQAASETQVKRIPLGDYRVVYFATHGLVAGDVKGLAEPSLALTLPAQPSETDDGLLTASEVAQLKLNADWVVLSACNTVAGDKPGAEALSGLARAFFYAGARALLVSHWAVASDAATRLATGTFDVLAREPALGRAEALRRTMVAFLSDTSDPKNAYPAFWAPFIVAGEGAAR